MERYTQFRDKATGISPFLPVLHTSVIGGSDSGVGNLIKTIKLDVIVSVVLFTVRSTLAIPLLVVSSVLSCILGKSSVVVVVLNRIILFIMGLTSYELTIQNLKAKNLNRSSFYPKKNDVFFVNFTSPLDIALLSLISNDEFVILIPNSQGNLEQIHSSWKFIKLSLCGHQQQQLGGGIKPLDYRTLQNKIIYIFPEGTTSNGKAILPFLLQQSKFQDFMNGLSQGGKNTYKIRTLGIKLYPSTLVTPLNYSIGSYIYKLLSTVSFSAKLRINIPNELDLGETDLVKLRSSFTNNGKFKLVSSELGVDSKVKFLESYVGRR